MYVQSLNIIEEAVPTSKSPEVAALLSKLGEFYSIQSEFAAAEQTLMRSREIWERVGRSDHPETASVLRKLAELYLSQGRIDEALPLYEKSLRVFQKTLGSDHPNTAAVLVSYNQLRRREETRPVKAQ